MNAACPKNRFTREDSAILFVDHQVGLILDVSVPDQETLRRNTVALARTAKAYNVPTILTTREDDGPNGPILPELAAELPDAELIRRRGELDVFRDSEFASAVRATGRRNLIIADIITYVGVSFAAIAAVASGYNVQAVLDASGTSSRIAAEEVIIRLRRAGVTITSVVEMTAELQRD